MCTVTPLIVDMHIRSVAGVGGGGGGAEGHLPPPPFIPERQVLEFYLHLNDLLPQIVDLVVLVRGFRIER